MNTYLSSAELKGRAKEHLFGKYGTVVGAYLIVTLLTGVLTVVPAAVFGSATIGGLIIYYLIAFILSLFTGILASGNAFLYLKLVCRQDISAGDVFYGFRTHPDKALILQFVISILSYLCLAPMIVFSLVFMTTKNPVFMLLMSVFFVIGYAALIIISLMLSQVFYLLQDFPQYSAKELIKMSCRIMKGHKGRLFYIQLSYVPLYLLGMLSCCVAFLWLMPYRNAVMAEFYMDLMAHRSNTPEDNL